MKRKASQSVVALATIPTNLGADDRDIVAKLVVGIVLGLEIAKSLEAPWLVSVDGL